MARQVMGVILLMLAGLLLFFEVWALADPVGTQMANDADPFGTPPGWREHATWFGIIALMSTAALWMIFGGGRTKSARRNAATHKPDRG